MQKPTRGSSKSLLRPQPALAVRPSGQRLRRGSRGQGMVEYALVLMLVAIVVIVILTVLGTHVGHMYSNINRGVQTASS
ncbi:MAG: Flp family type IVb pilin [Candidatus Dormibacteria bacterium]